MQTSLHERLHLLFALVFPKLYFLRSQSLCLGNQTSLTCKNGYCCKLELVRAKSVLVLRYSCNSLWRWLLTGGTVIPVSLIGVGPTVLEKSVFYE